MLTSTEFVESFSEVCVITATTADVLPLRDLLSRAVSYLEDDYLSVYRSAVGLLSPRPRAAHSPRSQYLVLQPSLLPTTLIRSRDRCIDCPPLWKFSLKLVVSSEPLMWFGVSTNPAWTWITLFMSWLRYTQLPKGK